MKNQELRIAFCGPSGTGKSSLAKAVAEYFDIPCLNDLTRGVANTLFGKPLPYLADELGRRSEFQRALLEAKIAMEDANKEFVTDRTHIDNIAYSIFHDANGTGSDDHFYGRSMDVMRTYTHIFFCDPREFIKLSDDPARKQSERYHMNMGLVMEALLSDMLVSPNWGSWPHGYSYVLGCDGDFDRRRDHVIALIEATL